MCDPMAKLRQHKGKLGLFLLGLLIASGSATPLPARADDAPSPFAIDSSHWISFDHYKEKVARPQLNSPAPEAPAASDDTASSAPSAAVTSATAETPATTDDAKQQTASTPQQPVPAAPMRALNLPVMPGLNKGYAVHVTTTEDDRQAAQITNLDTTPKVALPESNWQSAADATKHMTEESSAIKSSDNVLDLHVRLTYLPDAGIKPVLHDRKPTKGRDTTVAQGTAAAKEKKKSPEEQAACAAIDAYKKQQLDAIQKDRETLKALQNAIASLGLQKELNFMSGAQGSMDTAGGTDLPASPAATIK